MGGGISSPEHVGSSHILASKQLKTGQNGLFWQFLPISHSVDQFFDKNHYKYKVEGHFSLDPLESSNFRASKRPKMAYFGSFLPFDTLQTNFFGWNQLDLTQKSLTIYERRQLKSRSSWIQPYSGLKTAQNMAYFVSFCPFDTLQTNFLAGTNWISPKNHRQYMQGGILSQDQIGSSHILASISSKQPKMAFSYISLHATQCQIGKNCQNIAFQEVLSCVEAKIWLDPT